MKKRKIFGLVIISILLLTFLFAITACDKNRNEEANKDGIPIVTGTLAERWDAAEELLAAMWKYDEDLMEGEAEEVRYNTFSVKVKSVDVCCVGAEDYGLIHAFECDDEIYNSEELEYLLEDSTTASEYYGTNLMTYVKVPNTNIYATKRYGIWNVLANDVLKIGDAYYSKDKTSLLSYVGKETTFKFPEETKYIADWAFYACRTLTSIELPSGITSIGEGTFAKCSSLTSITIPEGVTHIDCIAFRSCSSLTSITIPESVTFIAWGAFRHCTSLSSIEIPKNVIFIGQHIFDGCTNLESIKFPDSLIYADYNALEKTEWYKKQPDGMVYAGKVAYRYKGDMPENTTITIKDGTFSTGYTAFSNCANLTNIVVPDSLVRVGCVALHKTGWYNSQADGMVYVGKVAYEYKGDMPENTEISLKNDTVSIVDSAFYDNTNLTSISIPKSVASIGSYAFEGCSNLTKISYEGTKAEFKAIKRGYSWLEGANVDKIECKDGNIILK
ncbi:MAG: leucine-rich repeat domain-containing protein [Christensenellales bacterium]|jgi:hypothetical protein